METRPRSAVKNERGERLNYNDGSGFEEIEERLSDAPESPSEIADNDFSAPGSRKKRKYNARLSLSDEQETELVEWLQSHPELFDKANKQYKDVVLKSRLWEEKASECGMESAALLHVWYKSMRTRFGKLNRLKSSDEHRQFSTRDQWILSNFAFMSTHIYSCPNRGKSTGTSTTLKRKMQSMVSRFDAGQSGHAQQGPDSDLEEDGDDEEEEEYYNIPTTLYTSPTPPTPAGATAPPSQGDNGMAKGYGTFLSTFVPSLHPSLLTQFYQESWGMVMRYHAQSESLKEEERQRPPIHIAIRRHNGKDNHRDINYP